MGVERRPVLDPAQVALLFEGAVVGQLAVGGGVGGLHRLVALDGRHQVGPQQPGQQRGDEDADPAAAQLGERHRALAAALAGHALLALAAADVGRRQPQVAVPVEGVPGEVEVGVEDEHAWVGPLSDGWRIRNVLAQCGE